MPWNDRDLRKRLEACLFSRRHVPPVRADHSAYASASETGLAWRLTFVAPIAYLPLVAYVTWLEVIALARPALVTSSGMTRLAGPE